MSAPPPPSSNFVRKYVPGTFFRTMLARGWGVAPGRTAGAALLVTLCLAACSGDAAQPAAEVGGDPSTVTREETTTASTVTTGATGTTAPSRPTAFAAQARDAVNELKAAWEAGDRARAAAIAPGDVVEALFVVPPTGFEVYGCDTGEFDTSTCNLRNRSSGAYITLTSERHPEGWQVATVFVDQG